MLEDAPNQQLLDLWRAGNQQAATILVRRFMTRLTALARARLSRKLARRLDPEDIVLSAWRSFFVAARDHRVSPDKEHDLWPLLVTITLRKLSHQAARHTAQARTISAESNLDLHHDWPLIAVSDPSPEDVALLTDEVEFLAASLDPADREVFTRTLQGLDPATIAAELDCSERTVRRSLQKIRNLISTRHSDRAFPAPSPSSPSLPRSSTPPPTIEHSPPQPTISLSDLLLKKLVGQGAFGKVYRASLKSTGQHLAVKYLKKRFWKDPRARQSFLHETATLSRLSHPNIIRHHGWGLTPTGALFIVIDWIDGPNAHDWAHSHSLSIPEVLSCGLAIASALSAAHQHQIIHADLSPRNVLHSADGRFLLTDFGFAHHLQTTTLSPLGGTPGFLAPEQLSDLLGPLSVRTDIYGLGALLYFLLTRQPPFSGQDVPEVLANVLSSRPPLPPSHLRPGVPPPLDNLILSCLAKEPSLRPPAVESVLQQLRSIFATFTPS